MSRLTGPEEFRGEMYACGLDFCVPTEFYRQVVPEAIEYALAEAGILKSAPVKVPEENDDKPQR